MELAAIYGALDEVKFEADLGDKKDAFRKDIEKSLLKEMDLRSAGKLSGSKLRHISYRGQEPLYGDRSSMHKQEAVASDGAFGPRRSFSEIVRSRDTVDNVEGLGSGIVDISLNNSNSRVGGSSAVAADMEEVISAMHNKNKKR